MQDCGENRLELVKSRVMDFWQNINIFNPNQFAYMEGRSTLSEILSCYDDWTKSRNNRKPTDIAFLDFSKAFDSVPHERLLFKLERHGIDGRALQRFRNFLTDRMQCVVIRGTCSSCMVSSFIRCAPRNNPRTCFIHLIKKKAV